ncbi:MAG: ABC transporter substrate-binding protein [Anaerolineales bacterium]|nr:ABC transporter substrate-binding protein [Anaerolineales bacterium]
MAIFLFGLQGCTPENPQIYRVGIICGANSLLDTINGFKSKMGELGFNEGQNILYDVQKVNNDPLGEQRFVKRFIGENVDLIFAFPNETAITAKILTRDTNIPVVFAYSAIEGTNLVNTLREPGGNITGVRYPILELTAKRLELLLDFDPTIKRVWVAYDPSYPLITNALLSLRPAAQSKDVTLVEVPVNSEEEVQAELAARDRLDDIGVDAIMIMPDLVTQSAPSWAAIAWFAEKNNLPISAIFYDEVKKGALFHYGLDYFQVGETAAALAAKILQGTPAGKIPLASPEGYLNINLIQAKALGITVADRLLKQAAEIIR